MSDAWLVIGIFVFAFILWAATGGPTRPISFAGPYITPITDIDDTQEAYDYDATGTKDSGESWWSGTRWGGSDTETADWGTVSPFKDQVQISSGSRGASATDTDEEYMTLRASSRSTGVDVTGWQLVSMKSGATVTIPQVRALNGQGANVVLAPSHEVIVTTGSSPTGSSFRENACSGYQTENRTFTPSLSGSCPTPTEELGDSFEGNAAAYNECREAVSGLARCTDASAPRNVTSRCHNFIEDRLNYAGCVRVHVNDAEFFGDTWRVYLGRGSELWRTDNEVIRLLDREGRTVDVYTY